MSQVFVNDDFFVLAECSEMDEQTVHPSYLRLVEVAQLCQVGEADIHVELGLSAARVGMWRYRGVSKTGAIMAAAAFGSSAEYIVNGGKLPAPQAPSHQVAALEEALSYITDKKSRYRAWRSALNAIAAFSPEQEIQQVDKRSAPGLAGKQPASRRS